MQSVLVVLSWIAAILGWLWSVIFHVGMNMGTPARRVRIIEASGASILPLGAVAFAVTAAQPVSKAIVVIAVSGLLVVGSVWYLGR